MAENKENKVAKENLMSLDQMPEKKGEYDVNNGSDENHSSHHPHRKHHSQKKRKVMKTIGWIASIIQLLLSLFLMFFLYLSAFLPNKYLVGILVGLIVLFILPRFLMKHYHHKGRFYTGLALAIVLSILFGVIGYYYQEIVNTAKGITGATSETTVYGVYVLKEDSAKELKDAKEYTFGILKSLDRTNTDKAIDKVNKPISSSVKTEEFEDMLTQADALSNKEVGAILLNEAYISAIDETEGYSDYSKSIREIAKIEIQTKTTHAKAEVAKKNNTDCFTVFISGIDVAGPISTTSRSEVNILATINPMTHQILLVSTPRDYYVATSVSNGAKDKLTHAGIYGINCSMDTLSALYDTDVDYYFRINFTGFKDVISALGSVTVHSDYAFKAGEYSYVEGENTLNADQALAFARERHAFAEGDRQRGKDQMYVIQGVMNKLSTPAVLNNYSELLKALEGSFQTSVPYERLSAMVNDQLSTGTGWSIQQYSVNGSGKSDYTYSMPRTKLYVMDPDITTVEQAKTYIQQIKNNEIVTVQN